MATYSTLEVEILDNTTGYIKVQSRLIDSREFFMLSEKFFNLFACCDFLIVVGAKGGVNVKPYSHEEHKEHSFDSFCKRILKNETRDYHRHLQYLREHEILFSELPEETLEQLAAWDRYFEDEYHFEVMGLEIAIADELLAEALQTLPQDRLEIVLLSYFLGMSDPEIADQLNLVRRTVAYRRTSSLQALKKFMEGQADE